MQSLAFAQRSNMSALRPASEIISVSLSVEKHGDGSSIQVENVELIGKKETVKLKKGETKKLQNGIKITFKSHSHKRTKAGQQSPLLIEFTFNEGNKEVSKTVSILGQKWWFYKDYVFIFTDHKYSEYQEFEVSIEPATNLEGYITEQEVKALDKIEQDEL